MPNTTEQTPNTSPIPFRSHTALLLSAALPFLQPSYRHPVELALKFLEFSETLKLFQEFHLSGKNPFRTSEDCEKKNTEGGLFGLIHTFVQDPEGLLQSLSGVCTGDEREIISMFLNIIRVKNFYETYGDLLQMPGLFSGAASTSDEQSTQSSAQKSPPTASSAGAPDFMGNSSFSPADLTGMLSDEQRETLDLLKSLFANE